MTTGAVPATVRELAAARGKRLSRITLAYNSAEGVLAIVAGLMAGSVALVGFGADSAIEVASSLASLYRLHHDADARRRDDAERVAARIVGWSFLLLAAWIAVDAGHSLYSHEIPDRSVPGIIIAAMSVVVMPALARRKRRVAEELGSRALSADATQTSLCAYLSVIVLGGLLLNAALGWWWADPVAALAMVPIIAREGLEGVRGSASCEACA